MSPLRFGYWLPVFGGWLRNVEDERMEATWDYVRDLAVRSEAIGFDITLIAELNLNDSRGSTRRASMPGRLLRRLRQSRGVSS
jgi:FMNH2-dependent dimethyl sulfone monooxygenase